MSMLIDAANALVAELNNAGAGWSSALNARRYYVPSFTPDELRTRRVSVVPAMVDIKPISRDEKQYDMRIDVAVQQLVEPDATIVDETARDADKLAKLDALMVLVDDIEDHFTAELLPGVTNTMCIGVENAPIFHPPHLEGKSVFTSVLTFTFRGSR